ncbi:stage II sporulation protein M [Pirellulaceae bacterium SH449]
MKIAEVLERRREGWVELENMCNEMRSGKFTYKANGPRLVRFSALYRAACTDLAMSDQYQLPPATIEYLHRLVGRAHSQLYRSKSPRLDRIMQYIFLIVPHAVFRDPCVILAALLFFGSFGLSAYIAFTIPKARAHAERILGEDQIEMMEKMHSSSINSVGSSTAGLASSAWYIQHNAGIGLQCFCLGPLILPTLAMLIFNGCTLGTVFGYMATSEAMSSANFFQFVTAHGPFELTAIALAAGAGMRIGVGLFSTQGFSRGASFRINAERSLPIILCSVILFILAAFTEGCLSPIDFPFLYLFKVSFAVLSSTGMTAYFLLLGWPTSSRLQKLAHHPDNPWRVRHAT